MPLAPSVEARAIARAAAVAESPQQGVARASSPPRWVFAAAAGLVLALGAGAYAARTWIAAPPPPVPARVAPIAAPRPSEPHLPIVAAPVETEAPEPIAPLAPPHVRRGVGKASAPAVATNAELQLLRTARQDVTRGDFAGALAVIAEHVRSFRNGALVEEREALRVKSLAGLGRQEEAQRAAAEFHRRFPHSVFLSTFERMKETDR
ncbi:MAG TPA: hypothetical protein VKQ32_05195 [Polyangia bacterium]|nr:hypothetical protein [Polyangia bacterium]